MDVKARLTSWQVSGMLRNYSASIPGKYGVADFGADMDAREISVSCSIFPKLRFSDLVETLDRIALWLSPVDGLKQLILMMCRIAIYGKTEGQGGLRKSYSCSRSI